ncbi:MAG TPA: ABC transporter substrate-binding protein, partial [Acidimicrobiales bacterium]|nr:ABC transporter substrate-binding protein [Acidimicrobiales bacterium]
MRNRRLFAATAVVVLVAAGCGSSKSSGNAAGGGAGGIGKTITIGVLTDLTGPAASGNKTYPQGVKAGVLLAKREGYTVKYVVADTQTSPTQALSAAQQLVAQDHVTAILAQSALTFGAAQYLNQQNVPVIGVAEDAGEWSTDKNMFPVGGALHTAVVTTTLGQTLKLLGASNIGTLGYGISPSSADSAKAASKSGEAAGLKSGYENANFPFGSTNVQP